jgi:hypothetical protein
MPAGIYLRHPWMQNSKKNTKGKDNRVKDRPETRTKKGKLELDIVNTPSGKATARVALEMAKEDRQESQQEDQDCEEER